MTEDNGDAGLLGEPDPFSAPYEAAGHRPGIAEEQQMAAPLFGRAVGGLTWSFGAGASTLALQLAYTATVSRVVAPEAFGLVALGGVLLRFVSYFAQLGLGPAVVQRSQLEEGDVRVAFTASTVLGVGMFAFAWALAPVVAPIFSPDPSLVAVSRALSGALVLSGIGVTAQAVLRRAFRFRVLAVVEIAAFAIGYLVVGVPLAVTGAGVWSLIAAALASTLVTTAAHLFFARHPMVPLVDGARLRALVSFGGAVSVIGFLEFVGSTLDTLAVGRFSGSSALGNYTRATALVTPVERFATATTAVLHPNFARIRSDRRRTANAYLSGYALLTAAIFPPAACLAAAAPAVVSVLLGGEWPLAAVLLPAISLAVAINLVTRFSGAVCEALGLLKGKLGIQVVHISTVAAVVMLTVARFESDPRGFALAWLAGEVVRQALYVVWLQRALAIPFRGTGVRLAEASLLAALPAMAVFLIRQTVSAPAPVELSMAIFAAVSVLVMSWFALPRLTIRQELRERQLVKTALGRGPALSSQAYRS